MDLLQELESRLTENTTLEQALSIFNEVCLIPDEYDGKMFYFNAKQYSGDSFAVDIVYQYHNNTDEFMQLVMEICYKQIPGIASPDSDDIWCETPDKLIQVFKSSDTYNYITDNNLQIQEIAVFLDET